MFLLLSATSCDSWAAAVTHTAWSHVRKYPTWLSPSVSLSWSRNSGSFWNSEAYLANDIWYKIWINMLINQWYQISLSLSLSHCLGIPRGQMVCVHVCGGDRCVRTPVFVRKWDAESKQTSGVDWLWWGVCILRSLQTVFVSGLSVSGCQAQYNRPNACARACDCFKGKQAFLL